MNTSATTWILAGALAASLAWNLKTALARPESAATPACEGAQCVSVPDLSTLGLTSDQTSTLQAWCAGPSAAGCALEAEAAAKLEALHAKLRDPAVSAATLHELAAEVNRLRARSLESCVESILEVRRVLTPAQLEKLMQCCDVSAGETNP